MNTDTMPKAKALHVLVTGAGFHLRRHNSIGMPSTRDILLAMGPPFGLEPLRLVLNSDNGVYPCFAQSAENVPEELLKCARVGDLDRYWDTLLGSQITGQPGSIIDKVSVYEREFSMRESFLRAVKRFDKGYLAQSTLAAALDWDVWIKTDFSQFADRAIDLLTQREGSGRAWRRFGDSGSAETLARFLLHTGSSQLGKHKYLFKIRGDATNVFSMALAGQDRGMFSNLSVPQDRFYSIFNAARMLITQHSSLPDASIIWHIVGYSMADADIVRLCIESLNLFKKAAFIIVSPIPSRSADSLRSFAEKSTLSAQLSNAIWTVPDGFFDYMHRVDEWGLPASSEPCDIRAWLESPVSADYSDLSRWALNLESLYPVDELRLSFQSCFLSHSSVDKEFCDRLYQDLQNRGVNCWYFPEDAVMGKPVWEEIDTNIKRYDRLIVVLSANSVKSGPVLREIERALSREDNGLKNILFPIRVDNVIFESWEHPRRADVLSKVVGDFSEWKVDAEKYRTSLERLLRGIQAK